MQSAARDRVDSTVAQANRHQAMAWLEGRLRWEGRLRQLERPLSPKVPATHTARVFAA